jgi:hypothetical protein
MAQGMHGTTGKCPSNSQRRDHSENQEEATAKEREVNFICQTWDNRNLSVDLEVRKEEPMNWFWPKRQKVLREEIDQVED